MGKGFVNVSGGGGSEEKLTAHLENKNNPHGVTAAQVGADVAGSAATVQNNLDTHDSNTTKHITDAERTAWNSKAAGSHTHSMSDITGLSAALANTTTTTLKLLAEYKTAGTRNVASLLTGMAFVYAVIAGGGEGGEGGGTGKASITAGAKGGDGGNIRIIGPLSVSGLTNTTVVVGAGGAGASSGEMNNPNHDAAPGGTSSAFGFTASGGGNTPAAGEIKGGSGGENDYSYKYTDVYTTGESLPLIDFFGIKSLSPGGGAGGTHHNNAGSAGGTSSVGNGGKGGNGTTAQGDGSYGSPGSDGGCTAGGGGGGGGTLYSNDYNTRRGGKGGNGGPGYVAIYGIPKGGK